MKHDKSKTNQQKSQVDIVYEIIRGKILNGELPLGKKLTRREVSGLTGVSTIPVIEALHRLEYEGLVEHKPYIGTSIIELTDEVLRERYELREAVECQIARILSKRINQEQKGFLTDLAEDLDATTEQGMMEDKDGFVEKHLLFHQKMGEFSQSRLLVNSLRNINLFSLLVQAEATYQKMNHNLSQYDHKVVVDAIVSGDPDYASEIMRKHIYRSGIVKVPLWCTFDD